jgi:hypothetical protein
MFEPVDAVMRCRMFKRTVQTPRDILIKRVDDERRLAAA